MAGIFINDPESRLDLFVIGDNVKTNVLAKVVKGMEADMGKEIRYTVISAPDFAYRTAMNDKLVRDIMDYPYDTLVDKLGISKA